MKRLALIMLLAAFALPVWSQSKSTDSSAPPKSATDDPAYVIGAEDVLMVSVWKEPDFSSTIPVRPDGMVSLPLLGDVPAAGRTPAVLAQDLTVRLKKYIDDPRVTVVVTAINSKRIYILGEVNHPGALNMSPNMTVLQAISAAGGPTAYANTKKISILRTEEGKQQKFPFNYKEVIKGNDSGQNIVLKAGDTIVVP
ncbi:MAG TPA: polysaccharide biosynthesis/export family protein [Terriglobales bacterium]|nr:polysaccharide biosynthesis/export family protein [Terriglobales bacterium]